MTIQAILDRIGVDSLDELEREIETLRSQVQDLEDSGLGSSQRANNFKESLDECLKAKDACESLSTPSEGVIDCILDDLGESSVESLQERLAEYRDQLDKFDKEGKSSSVRAHNVRDMVVTYEHALSKIKAFQAQHKAATITRASEGDIDCILDDLGESSVESLQERLAEYRDQLDKFDNQGKSSSVRARNVRDMVVTYEHALSKIKAFQAQCQAATTTRASEGDIDCILDDLGESSVESLQERLAEYRDQLDKFDKEGKSSSVRARNVRDMVVTYEHALSKIKAFQAQCQAATTTRASEGDIDCILEELGESNVESLQERLAEYRDQLDKFDNQGKSSSVRARNVRDMVVTYEHALSKIKAFQAQCQAATTTRASEGDIDCILEELGESNVESLQERLAEYRDQLDKFDNQGKSSSVRARNVRDMVVTYEHALSKIKAFQAQCQAAPTTNMDITPYFVHIFHDVENCRCEGRLGLNARVLVKYTLEKIMCAFLGSMEAVNVMDFDRDLSWKWDFCIRRDSNNVFHPSKLFVRDMDTVGAMLIDVPGMKKGEVDKRIERNMRTFAADYQKMNDDAKQKTAAVLIASDGDYSSVVDDLKRMGILVILIYDPAECSDVFKSIVSPRYSLGVWQEILDASKPMAPGVNNSTRETVPNPQSDREYASLVFALADFMYVRGQSSCFYPVYMKELLKENPEIGAINTKYGGLESFCGRSNGALCYQANNQGGLVSVALHFLLEFWVRLEGGKVPANRIGKFYKKFPRCAENNVVKSQFRESGGAPALCSATGGSMIWIQCSDDSTVGYGYFECTAGNIDKTTNSCMWTISWLLHNHLKYLSKPTVDEVLLRVSPNVVLELCGDSQGARLRLSISQHFESSQQSISDPDALLKESRLCVEEFLRDLQISPLAEVPVPRSVLLGDTELRTIRKQYQVYCNVYKRRQENTCGDDAIFMLLPKHMSAGPNVPANRSPQRHPNKSAYDIEAFAYSHLVKLGINRVTHIVKLNIRKEPVLHAYIVLSRDALDQDRRNRLLSSQSSNGVSFCESLPSPEAREVESIQLIYPSSNAEGAEKVMDRINELRHCERELDVFDAPGGPPDTSSYRPAVENYFFMDAVWCFLISEINDIAPGLQLEISQRQQKRVIVVRGLEKLVELAETRLRERRRKILEKTIAIPRDKQSKELNDALKNYLKSLFSSWFRAYSSDQDGTSSLDTRSNSDETSVSSSTSVRMPLAKYYVARREVCIVALHERQDQWQLFVKAAKNIIDSFTRREVSVSGENPTRFNRALSKFDLLDHKYDKDTKNIILHGARESVLGALAYIEQEMNGQQPESADIDCSEFPHSDRIARYLRRGGEGCALAQLQNFVSQSFKSVTLTIPQAANCESNSNNSTILTLRGPKNMIPAAIDATKVEVRKIVAGLELSVIDCFQDYQVKWLMQYATHIGDENDTVVDFVSEDVFSTVGDPQLKCQCEMGPISVYVVHCDFIETASYGCDTIVNSANSHLKHDGGIAKAISDAAGPELVRECNSKSHIPAGGATATGSYRLHDHGFKNIIHTVAPVWSSSSDGSVRIGERHLLHNAVKNALYEAQLKGAEAVAIPGVGMGLFKWPVDDAATEIVLAIGEFIHDQTAADDAQKSLKKIVLFDNIESRVSAFVSALKALQNHTIGESVSIPTVPECQWFRKVWHHEVSEQPDGAVRTLFDESFVEHVVAPYDYDQVMQMERAYLAGDSSVILVSDAYGAKNNKKYKIDFTLKTQTTIPFNNKFSVRPIFRSSVIDPKNIPMYNERCKEQVLARPGIVERVIPTNLKTGVFVKNRDGVLTQNSLQRENGVAIFGTSDAIKKTITALDNFILENKSSKTVELRLLRTSNVQFETALHELQELNREMNVVISSSNDADWNVIVEGLGEVVVLRAQTKVLEYERNKVYNDSRAISLPDTWGYELSDDDCFPDPSLKELEPISSEYIEAAKCFGNDNFKADIVRIERVQNVELYRLYDTKRKEVARKNGGNANEILLKHGTSDTLPETVWNSGSRTNAYGFDIRWSSDKNYYGRGSYFTDDTGYANRYSYQCGNSDERQIFLAYVAQGCIEQKDTKDKSIKTPSAGYQSVRGPIDGSIQGLVVYELHQSYPAYLVTYKRAPK